MGDLLIRVGFVCCVCGCVYGDFVIEEKKKERRRELIE
jgi:hypothetical protein